MKHHDGNYCIYLIDTCSFIDTATIHTSTLRSTDCEFFISKAVNRCNNCSKLRQAIMKRHQRQDVTAPVTDPKSHANYRYMLYAGSMQIIKLLSIDT